MSTVTPTVLTSCTISKPILWNELTLVDLPEYQDVVEKMRAQLQDWFIRYTDPLKDGRHEAVTGQGQLALAGPAGRGVQAFALAEWQNATKTT